VKTINAIDKDALLIRLYAERSKIARQMTRNLEPVARYDFAICAIESEPSAEAEILPKNEVKTI